MKICKKCSARIRNDNKTGFCLKCYREEISAWNKGKTGKEVSKCSYYISNKKVNSLFDISSRTVSKILLRLNKPCSYCGWHIEGAVGDIHHIIPKKDGGTDDHSNLTYICPNCHRLWHSGIIKSEEFISIDKYIGDEWKQFYFATIE